MNELVAFTAISHDEGHFIQHAVESPTAFFTHAEQVLTDVRKAVYDRVISDLENRRGLWHPLGFMVYHLGVNEEGESLRLHIWPAGDRTRGKIKPNIHNHAWHLASLVMEGQYSDTFYDLEEVGKMDEEERQAYHALRKYNLDYHPNGVDALQTDGSCVKPHVVDKRKARRGEVHTIVDGIFHVPTIPLHETLVTLVLDTANLGYDTTVALDCAPDPVKEPRQLVTSQEAVRAKKLILNGNG